MAAKQEVDNLESVLDDALADFGQSEAQQKGFRMNLEANLLPLPFD